MNINKGLGLIALAIVCSVVLIVTENFQYFTTTGIFGGILVLLVCDD